MDTFTEKLEVGRIGENIIAKWFINRGFNVLPAYEIEVPTGKGPRIFTATGGIISPDMLVFNHDKIFWIEAKTKSAFTWHRISRTFQTGIDKRHWEDYLKIQSIVNWPIWLIFWHKPGLLAKDTPPGMISPSGLFGNDINILKNKIHHSHDNHGSSGMVYWTHDSFILLANTLEELRQL